MLLHAPVERFVKFDDLPSAEPFFADQKHEGGRLGDAFGEFGEPKAAGAESRRGEEDLPIGILAPQRSLEPLHQRQVLRIVAKKPPRHDPTSAQDQSCRSNQENTTEGIASAPAIAEQQACACRRWVFFRPIQAALPAGRCRFAPKSDLSSAARQSEVTLMRLFYWLVPLWRRLF